ncbi:hypothetical protein [Okeania sp. SIO2B3]|nr:hypothetical protein [Okeania sp. SIO2B3]
MSNFGILVGAIATVITMIMWNILPLEYVVKKLNLYPYIYN